jgi:hypothetical protein
MAQKPPDPKVLGYYHSLAQVGLEMVAPIGIGAWLDYMLGWRPWLTVAGAVVGFVGGLAHLLALLNRQPNESQTENDDRDSP